MNSDHPIMKCGHAANAHMQRDGKDVPCCAICFGSDGAEEIKELQPDLTGRKARCFYGDNETASSNNLPFFDYCDDKEYDRYYCGCFGFD